MNDCINQNNQPIHQTFLSFFFFLNESLIVESFTLKRNNQEKRKKMNKVNIVNKYPLNDAQLQQFQVDLVDSDTNTQKSIDTDRLSSLATDQHVFLH